MTDNNQSSIDSNGIIPPLDDLPLEIQRAVIVNNNRSEKLRNRLYFETEYKVAGIVKDEGAKQAAKEALKKVVERLDAVDAIIADIDQQIAARDIALNLSQKTGTVWQVRDATKEELDNAGAVYAIEKSNHSDK